MKASVPVGKCGPCVSMTPIGNRTAAPRLAAAAICGAVISAIVSDRSARKLIGYLGDLEEAVLRQDRAQLIPLPDQIVDMPINLR
jgi:hypothetical protein